MRNFLIIFISLIIISCSNISLTTEPIVINTISNGDVLTKGDVFSISFIKTDDSITIDPYLANIKIVPVYKDRSVDDVKEINIEVDIERTPEPVFEITDDFEDGLYELFVDVYDKEDIVANYNSEFVVYSGELTGVITSLYPSKDLYTDSVLIVESDIFFDKEIDPYLVWYNDDEVFTEGYYSDGLDKIVWDTEDKIGFIDLKLELFPYKLSSNKVRSENFVDISFVVNPLSNTLYSESILQNYSKALFFNGNYIDEINKDLNIHLNNKLIPKVFNSNYGMLINKETGFSTNDSIFPMDENENSLSFSLIFDFLPLGDSDGLLVESRDDLLDFKLFVENGEIICSYLGKEDLNTTVVGSIVKEKLLKVVISFIKNDAGYKMFFYYNGALAGTSNWVIPVKEDGNISDIREFSLGSNNDQVGFEAIIENFCIYYKDNEGRNNLYSNNIGDLISDSGEYQLLEGFNTLYSPVELVGDCTLDGEIISLKDGAYLDYRDVLPTESDYILKINSIHKNSYIIVLYGDDDFKELDLEGESVISKTGNQLFVNDKPVTDLDFTQYSNFKIVAREFLELDYITVESLGVLIEEEN